MSARRISWWLTFFNTSIELGDDFLLVETPGTSRFLGHRCCDETILRSDCQFYSVGHSHVRRRIDGC